MSVKSSSGTIRKAGRRAARLGKHALTFGFTTHTPLDAPKLRPDFSRPQSVPQELLDDPRVKALIDWHDKGGPDSEIDTSGAPELTEEQLAEMTKARLRIGRQ